MVLGLTPEDSMPARRYRPSGKTDPLALELLLLGCVGVGLAVGIVEGFVAYHAFTLRGWFPGALGAAVGGFAYWWIGKARIRAPGAAAALALLGGVVGQAAVHRTGYELFRLDATLELRRTQPRADARAEIDRFLVARTGQPGWVGYMKLVASVGITETRLGFGGPGNHVSGTRLWADWAFELLLVACCASALAVVRARAPFCEGCNRWYDLIERVATGSPRRRDWKTVVAALEAGEGAGALALRGEPKRNRWAVFRLRRCSACETHAPILQVSVAKTMVRRGERHDFERACHETLVTPELAAALLAFGRLEEPLTSSAADRW